MNARDGSIITVAGLRRMTKQGWRLTTTHQTIDGVGYWVVEHANRGDTRLIRCSDCDDENIHPTND